MDSTRDISWKRLKPDIEQCGSLDCIETRRGLALLTVSGKRSSCIEVLL
jgi:hypothetical protein